MSNQKHQLPSPLLLISLCAVAILGATTYLFQKQATPSTPQSSAAPSTQADAASTYTDTATGLSFQYPSDWGPLSRREGTEELLAFGSPKGTSFLLNGYVSGNTSSPSATLTLITASDADHFIAGELVTPGFESVGTSLRDFRALLATAYTQRSLDTLTLPGAGALTGHKSARKFFAEYAQSADASWRGVAYFMNDTDGFNGTPLEYDVVLTNSAQDILSLNLDLYGEDQRAIDAYNNSSDFTIPVSPGFDMRDFISKRAPQAFAKQVTGAKELVHSLKRH